MTPSDFTEHPLVTKAINDLKNHFAERPLIVSDMIDADGNQYVDLVQEGGGVWGVALLGYTYVLECFGVRFASMAGTSAGAINTLLLASAGTPEEKRTEKILPYLANKDFFEFVDGNVFSRMTVRALARREPKILLALRGLLNYPRVRRRLGLNPGDAFKTWLEETIAEFGVHSFRDLQKRMNAFTDSIRHRQTGTSDPDMRTGKLALIAAEIETGSKIRFPAHAPLFFRNHLDINPAEFVRASMSIPLFFEPVVIPNEALPHNDQQQWRNLLGHTGHIPRRAILVDGGILSNFPIDVFHRRGTIPLRPTLGVKLRTLNKRFRKPHPKRPLSLGGFLGGNFSAARHLRDHEFIFSNPDYRKLVAQVDVSGHSWMNFGISNADKVDLFVRGVQAAQQFLTEFDWEKYKTFRATLIAEAIQARKRGILRATGESRRILQEALEGRQIRITERSQTALLERMQDFGRIEDDFAILWVDDQDGRNFREKELLHKLGPGVAIVEAHSSEEALQLIRERRFQLMISDILRNASPSEGVDFLLLLQQKRLDIPTIFYINNFNPARGIPMGAFGITDSPAELIHLVIDAAAREGIPKKGADRTVEITS
ncbi:MAG: patatin-like phospholipase family protein [Bacteroidota bacterium]